MLTLEESIKLANTPEQRTADARLMARLTAFMTVEQIESDEVGFSINDENVAKAHKPKPFTEEAVKQFLKEAVDFGFQKALDHRGISVSLYHVVHGLVQILEDEELTTAGYTYYGLPFLKAVALKYGFNNPIGDKKGNEHEYA